MTTVAETCRKDTLRTRCGLETTAVRRSLPDMIEEEEEEEEDEGRMRQHTDEVDTTSEANFQKWYARNKYRKKIRNTVIRRRLPRVIRDSTLALVPEPLRSLTPTHPTHHNSQSTHPILSLHHPSRESFVSMNWYRSC